MADTVDGNIGPRGLHDHDDLRDAFDIISQLCLRDLEPTHLSFVECEL